MQVISNSNITTGNKKSSEPNLLLYIQYVLRKLAQTWPQILLDRVHKRVTEKKRIKIDHHGTHKLVLTIIPCLLV